MVTTTLYRALDLEKMPDDYELDRGRLVRVMPGSPVHGKVCGRVVRLLGNYCDGTGAGEAFSNDTGFWLEKGPDTVRGPDVAFVRAERLAEMPRKGFWDGPPDLAVEVVSDGDSRGEVLRKVGQYLDAGCLEVWVIDPFRRHVVLYGPDGEVRVLGPGERVQDRAVVPGLEAEVAWLLGD